MRERLAPARAPGWWGATDSARDSWVRFGALSGGQLKRTMIARAMVTTPRLLLLDEPEAGIDVGGEQTLYELLDRLVSHHRLTALICSHELDLVFRFADRVLCLNRRLQCTGPPAEILTADALARLYGPATALYRHRPGEAT